MQRYQAYRKSGVFWLDDIPEHWNVSYSKWIFKDRNEKAGEDDEQLTASQKYGVLSQSEFMRLEKRSVTQVVKNHDILKRAEPGDFVISMRSFQGGIEYCPFRGAVSSAYVPLYARLPIRDKYFKYLFKSHPYIQALQSTSNLVRDGQALRYNNFIQVDLPMPPLAEQESIGIFLDRETSRIDDLINEKQAFLNALKEKRLALVHEVIGNSASQMLRLQHCVVRVWRPTERVDEQFYVPIGIYNRGRGIFHKDVTLGKDLGDSEFSYIHPEDLVISGQFAWEGAVALVSEQDEGCVASHRYFICKGRDGALNTNFLWAYLTTQYGDFLFDDHSKGAAGRNRPLNVGSFLKEKIPIPPMELQLQVAKLVQKEKALQLVVKESIELLNEHRAALISAAVTGKIDVREQQ